MLVSFILRNQDQAYTVLIYKTAYLRFQPATKPHSLLLESGSEIMGSSLKLVTRTPVFVNQVSDIQSCLLVEGQCDCQVGNSRMKARKNGEK